MSNRCGAQFPIQIPTCTRPKHHTGAHYAEALVTPAPVPQVHLEPRTPGTPVRMPDCNYTAALIMLANASLSKGELMDPAMVRLYAEKLDLQMAYAERGISMEGKDVDRMHATGLRFLRKRGFYNIKGPEPDFIPEPAPTVLRSKP